MKKQILFLAFLAISLIVGTSSAFGQLSPGVTISTGTQPIPALTCAANASPLHPLAGQPYTYQMTGTNANLWTWFATKDPSFISTAANGTTTLNTTNMLTVASGALLNASATYGVATAGANSVSITWSPSVIAGTGYQGLPAPKTPTFVVGYATGQNCADNIQVYEINPIVNFTVDIANIDALGATLNWDIPTSQCADIVRSASYNATSKEIDVNYGTNTLYFEVAAANFVKNFTPVFRLISGLSGAQSAVVTLHASKANAIAGTNSLGTTTWTSASVGSDWATGVALTATNAADIVNGVSVYVKVVITNSTYESLAANPFELAVDARENDNTGIWDMEDADCATLADAADQVDRAVHTINPRPQLDHSTVDAGAPNPTRWIPKTPTAGGF